MILSWDIFLCGGWFWQLKIQQVSLFHAMWSLNASQLFYEVFNQRHSDFSNAGGKTSYNGLMEKVYVHLYHGTFLGDFERKFFLM